MGNLRKWQIQQDTTRCKKSKKGFANKLKMEQAKDKSYEQIWKDKNEQFNEFLKQHPISLKTKEQYEKEAQDKQERSKMVGIYKENKMCMLCEHYSWDRCTVIEDNKNRKLPIGHRCDDESKFSLLVG